MSPAQPTLRQIRRRRRSAIGGIALLTAIVVCWVIYAAVFGPVNRHGAEVTNLTIHSKSVGRDLNVGVVVPAEHGAAARKPLLVFLHGKDESVGSFTDDDEPFFRALSRLGDRAPVVAFPADDGDSYWHDRETGRWGSYVIAEVIPQVSQRFDTDPSRVAIGGISMGGFGAYNLALQNPGRFCAVGGHSPALWFHAADTAPGAFDDAEDFARNDVLGAIESDPTAFGPIPIWNDAGTEDPFLISDVALDEDLEAAGANLTAHTWPGAHERPYWDRHWNAYLRFYSDALADCQ
jgi:enterochelin esterase-like enzyme